MDGRPIVLYGEPRSRAFRCIWMLEELGLEFELVPVRFGGIETRKPEFLAINPNGRVPALVDGELVLYESLAINHYLATRYGVDTLEASTPRGRAEALRWSFWAMGEIEGPVDAVARHGARRADDWATGPLSGLDAALTDADWLVEPRFTVADLNVAVMFWRPVLARVDRGPWPRLRAWIERCTDRPAWRRTAARFEAR
jgi:glutathione S-transferase